MTPACKSYGGKKPAHNRMKWMLDYNRVIYFSYETPIAVYCPSEYALFIRKNIWGRTTGMHMKMAAEDIRLDAALGCPIYEGIEDPEFNLVLEYVIGKCRQPNPIVWTISKRRKSILI